MKNQIVYLYKDQIDWKFVNIRNSHGEESFELWQSLSIHGQLQPGAGWWLDNGKFRILYGHRRAVVLTTHGKKFMAMIVPQVNDVITIEKQLIENEQRLSLNPMEEEKAIRTLRDHYRDDEKISKRIGRSKSWIKSKLIAKSIRDDILDAIDKQGDNQNGFTKKDLEQIPTSIINKTKENTADSKMRLDILKRASKKEGGINTKNIKQAIYDLKIKDSADDELKLELIKRESEYETLKKEEKKIKAKINIIVMEITDLKKKLNY